MFQFMSSTAEVTFWVLVCVNIANITDTDLILWFVTNYAFSALLESWRRHRGHRC